MSNFSNALTEIVTRSFSGNNSHLARECGIDPSIISRLCSDKIGPSLERLDLIGSAMSRPDRKQLLMAAARDQVPSRYQDEIFGDEDPASQILRAKLSPDIAAVIRYLESNAMTDESTAAYLRKIGDWIGITTPAAKPAPLRSVAEEPAKYKTNGKSA